MIYYWTILFQDEQRLIARDNTGYRQATVTRDGACEYLLLDPRSSLDERLSSLTIEEQERVFRARVITTEGETLVVDDVMIHIDVHQEAQRLLALTHLIASWQHGSDHDEA